MVWASMFGPSSSASSPYSFTSANAGLSASTPERASDMPSSVTVCEAANMMPCHDVGVPASVSVPMFGAVQSMMKCVPSINMSSDMVAEAAASCSP